MTHKCTDTWNKKKTSFFANSTMPQQHGTSELEYSDTSPTGENFYLNEHLAGCWVITSFTLIFPRSTLDSIIFTSIPSFQYTDVQVQSQLIR
jgi:hypothetical protein